MDDPLLSKQENKLGINTIYNDLINNIKNNGSNISNANLGSRVGFLYMAFQTLLEKIVTIFINFMSKTQAMLSSFDMAFKERDTRLVNLENKVNQMGLQFLPIIKERQKLDDSLKENSNSMYSGGNKTGTRRRRNVNKRRK
jgi:hypothetical protein